MESEDEPEHKFKRNPKKIERKKEYRIPNHPGEGIRADTAYKYVGRPFAWWWRIAGSIRGRFVIAIILTALSMSLSTVPAAVIGRFVDDVYGAGDLSKVLPYCALIILVPVLRSILGLSYRGIYENSSQNLLMRLRAGVYKHLQDLDQPYYDKTSVGDIMARMTGDLDMVRHFTSYVIMAMLEQVILFIVGMILMFSISWILALSTLVMAPVIIVLANRFRKEVRPVWDDVRQRFSLLNAAVQQNISGNRVVKAFVRKDYEVDRFERENEAYREINLKSVSVWVKYIPALEGISNLLAIPVILVGGILVINGRMSLGGLVAFNGILFVISNPMRMLGGLMNEIQRFSASAEKIIELLHERPNVKSPEETESQAMDQEYENEIEFENVYFKYSNPKASGDKEDAEDEVKKNCVLKDITFSVKKGQRIGIIGATGSGKTTLINLILRYYDASQGKIKIRGKNIKRYDLKDLRRKIGIVMQDVFLFSDTVEGNIAYGRPQAPFSDVEQAARNAQADGFISSMPEGYDTIVGERGVGLSGGQRQRISLARALCFEPEIMILDDTTSAIDMETEFLIQNNLETALKGKTVITVAHRLSSVRNADIILVLDRGRIVERGTHDELISLKGIYYDVYLTQSGLIHDLKNGEEVNKHGKK